MSQVFSIEIAPDVRFVCLFLSSQKIHPRQLTIHIFILFFFPLRCLSHVFSFFFAPIFLYTSSCNSFLDIWHWNNSHVPHFSRVPFPCHFPLNSSSFEFLTFSYFLSSHAVLSSLLPSSPANLSNQYLFSYHSYHLFMLSMFVTVRCVQLVTLSSKYCFAPAML